MSIISKKTKQKRIDNYFFSFNRWKCWRNSHDNIYCQLESIKRRVWHFSQLWGRINNTVQTVLLRVERWGIYLLIINPTVHVSSQFWVLFVPFIKRKGTSDFPGVHKSSGNCVCLSLQNRHLTPCLFLLIFFPAILCFFLCI